MEQTPKLKNQTEQIVESFDDAIKKLNEIKERVAKNQPENFVLELITVPWLTEGMVNLNWTDHHQ